MVQDPAKPFFSNITVSDLFVPVDVRPERRFGIVGVDHFDILDAEHTVNFSHRLPDAGRRRDIVTGSMAMAGVDAKSDCEIRCSAANFRIMSSSSKPAAESRARTRRVFKQYSQLLRIQTSRRFGQRPNHAVDSFFHRMAPAIPRMRHQILRANRERPFHLAAKSSHRLRAQSFAARSKIDQVIVVDD